jgi:hypothetical protein
VSAPSTALATPATPSDAGELAAVFDQLLRDRGALYRRLEEGDDLAGLARSLVAIAVVCAAVFGAAIGAYRGGVQIGYAAIKLPLAMMLTAAVCAPSWTALRRAFGAPSSLARDLVATLVALAMSGLVLVGLAPLLLVGVVLEVSYHSMALGLVGCALLAGGAGIGALWSARSSGGRGRAPLAIFLSLLVLVGAQMSWTLRPYLVRPRTVEVPFIRAVEGSVIGAALESWSSARGIYDDDHPEAHQTW